MLFECIRIQFGLNVWSLQGAAGEANALESQIGDLKKEIQAIANTKELEAKLQTKIAQDSSIFP